MSTVVEIRRLKVNCLRCVFMVVQQSADEDCVAHRHSCLFIAERTVRETVNIWASNVPVQALVSTFLCIT